MQRRVVCCSLATSLLRCHVAVLPQCCTNATTRSGCDAKTETLRGCDNLWLHTSAAHHAAVGMRSRVARWQGNNATARRRRFELQRKAGAIDAGHRALAACSEKTVVADAVARVVERRCYNDAAKSATERRTCAACRVPRCLRVLRMPQPPPCAPPYLPSLPLPPALQLFIVTHPPLSPE